MTEITDLSSQAYTPELHEEIKAISIECLGDKVKSSGVTSEDVIN